MLDRIPTPGQEGRVLVTPEDGSAPFYAKIQMADNPTQDGDPFAKFTMLHDAVAAAYDKDDKAVPNDIFAVLSRFHKGLGNEYVWAKTEEETELLYDVSNVRKSFLWTTSSDWSKMVVYYGDSFTIEDGGFVFVNEQSLSPSSNTDVSGLNSNVVGKYYWCGWTRPEKFTDIYYAPAESSFSWTNSGSTYGVALSSGQNYTNPSTEIISTPCGYVNSPDHDAYPIDDGYTYTALGQLGEKVKVELVSYVGTGTYGENNTNSLTFDSAPILVWYVGQDSASGSSAFSPAPPSGNFQTWVLPETMPTNFTNRYGFGDPNYIQGKRSADGKTIYWHNYSNQATASDQLNHSNGIYYFIVVRP